MLKHSLILILLITAVSFKVADEIELDQFLNARTSPHFAEYSKNIKTTLSKGTTGKVVDISKPFSSGNYGVKMSLTNGPRKGETYWVYFNKKNPDLKLFNADKKETAEIPAQAVKAVVLRTTAATRDISEHALIESAKKSNQVLLNSASRQIASPGQKVECDPVKDNSATNTDCESCYSPAKALADINSGNLKFMGRDLLPGHDQNRSCVFENDEAYVIYHNCTGNRKEAPAMEIDVISKKGGRISYYMETYSGGKISQTPRSKYHGTWSVSFDPSDAPGKLSMSGIKTYMSSLENNSRGGCWVGEMAKAQDMNTTAKCYGEAVKIQPQWSNTAEKFWKDPGESWIPTQSKLRKLVETAPF